MTIYRLEIEHKLFFTRMALRFDLSVYQLQGVHTVYWAHGSPLRCARSARHYQRGDYRRAL